MFAYLMASAQNDWDRQFVYITLAMSHEHASKCNARHGNKGKHACPGTLL